MNPTSIDHSAPVIARHSALITAPVDVVWRRHTDINRWPLWQKAIDAAHLDGLFAPEATFTWHTHNLTITSTVYGVDDHRHTLWGGPSEGITGIHSWTFTPTPDGVVVEPEESWSGDPVNADRANMQAALDGSLKAWLDYLASAATK